MKGIGAVVNVFTKEDEKVIIQPPVYYPFRLTPQGNGRKVVFNPLKRVADGSYKIDFENLAQVTGPFAQQPSQSRRTMLGEGYSYTSC